MACLLLAAWSVTGCERGDTVGRGDPLMDVFRRQAQEEGLSRVQTEGKRLFAHYCVTCHGEHGEGDGQNAYNLEPAPPNFHESLRAQPSSYWREIISGGTVAVGRSALCPPRGRTLSSEEIDALLVYLEVIASEPAESRESEPR